MTESEYPTFIEKARETYQFHREKIINDDEWTIAKTAKALRRSVGSICEDLLIAKWCKTHKKQIMKFSYAYQALEWIRENKKELEYGDID